jgi:hypothetical protein
MCYVIICFERPISLEAQGRTLYTDNYYTSMSLVKHLYNKYRWTCVGTIVPTEKNERASHDLLFHKLSNGARNMIERGWYCKAAIKLRAKNSRHNYFIQCTTWKDKKQVMFLSNNKVGRSVGLTVSRRVREKKPLETVPGPLAQADYIQNFNAIDRNNQDSADYSTTITRKCTGDQISLGITLGKYFWMCYRKQVTTELTAMERKWRCRTSAMGCAICQEPICKECWKEGYDKHT